MNRAVRLTRRLLDLALMLLVAIWLFDTADDGDEPATRPGLKTHSSELAD